jgi:hypothetical protein
MELPNIEKEALEAEKKALDSSNTAEKDDFKVEIIDDTPEEDRNKPPLPKRIVEELENDPLDEYSEKVQNRIKQMKKVWHDERREKERYAREREEALTFAQRAYEENKQLKQKLTQNQKAYIDEATRAADTELASAKETLRRAHEAGDPEQIVSAQEALADAKIRIREVERFKPALQQPDNNVQEPKQPEVTRQVTDPKAEAWRQRNTWFGQNEEMTSLALGLHNKLHRLGVEVGSDDYYRKLDSEIRKRFPEEFEDSSDTSQQEERQERPVTRKPPTVVAPVTRATAPRQIRLSTTEAAIAKRLGLTPEAYAREKIKLENNNG